MSTGSEVEIEGEFLGGSETERGSMVVAARTSDLGFSTAGFSLQTENPEAQTREMAEDTAIGDDSKFHV